MTPLGIGLSSAAALIALIALRVPIAVALGIVALTGTALIADLFAAAALLAETPFEFAAQWSLSAVPMFLLMGAVTHRAGVSQSLFDAARLWLGALPGGLAVAANLASAGFAAASGSSIATAAAMGRIAIPEMLRHRYAPGLAAGVVASAGTLGSMIPPSILFVLYGAFAEVSIVELLLAGLLPGLLTAAVYTVMIVARCTLNPALAPAPSSERPARTPAAARRARWRALGEASPIALLIGAVIGGLYAGWFTPTEAGAVGSLLACLIAIFQRRFTLATFRDSLADAVGTTAQIFFIGAGAVMYSKFLALSGLSPLLTELIGEWALDPLLLVIAAAAIYLVLGMFLEPLGMMLLTLPVLLPMFDALELDLIWFGVLVVKFAEIALLTPPVGLNVYVLRNAVGGRVPLETIFRGVAWFLACEAIVVMLLIGFPQIALWLPGTLG